MNKLCAFIVGFALGIANDGLYMTPTIEEDYFSNQAQKSAALIISISW